VLFWGFLGLFVPAVKGTKPRSSSVSSQANAILKGMSDERQSRPTFVGVVELPDKIGRQNR